MGLKLNYNKLMLDYKKALEEELEYALKAWEAEVYANHKSTFAFKKRGQKKPLEVYTYIENVRSGLKAYLQANTSAIADSYGTGSLMDVNNPDLKRYIGDKGDEEGQFNPARTGLAITGRPAGEYIDIFGRHRRSSGAFVGENMEGMEFHGFKIEPIPPSKAIQNATKALLKTYIPNAIKLAREKIKMSKYIIEVK